METIKRFEPVALLVMVVGALNWGMVGLFDTNVISDVFGDGTLTDIVYVVVGVCGLLYIPRLLDSLHIAVTRRTRAAPEWPHESATDQAPIGAWSRLWAVSPVNDLELGHQAMVLVVEHVAVDRRTCRCSRRSGRRADAFAGVDEEALLEAVLPGRRAACRCGRAGTSR